MVNVNYFDLEQLKEFVSTNPPIDEISNILVYAAHSGCIDAVTILLDSGANVHAQDDSALKFSAYAGNVDVVKILLEAGADPHVDNDIALQNAIQYGYYEIAKILLAYGANVHAHFDKH